MSALAVYAATAASVSNDTPARPLLRCRRLGELSRCPLKSANEHRELRSAQPSIVRIATVPEVVSELFASRPRLMLPLTEQRLDHEEVFELERMTCFVFREENLVEFLAG